MKLFVIAAVMAALACPAMAEEAKADRAVQKLELAAEAPYWLIVCEREFMARPNLAPDVYAFTMGALSAMSQSGQTENLTHMLNAVAEMGQEGSRDKDAKKFSASQCERLVADFAESWQSL